MFFFSILLPIVEKLNYQSGVFLSEFEITVIFILYCKLVKEIWQNMYWHCNAWLFKSMLNDIELKFSIT